MKGLFIFFLLLVASESIFSQNLKCSEIRELKEKTCYVLLLEEDGELYNTAIKNAVSKYWKFCRYEFVTQGQLLKQYPAKTTDVLLLGYFNVCQTIYGANTRPDLLAAVAVDNEPIFGLSKLFKNQSIKKSSYSLVFDFYSWFYYPKTDIPESDLQAWMNMYIALINNELIALSEQGTGFDDFMGYWKEVKKREPKVKSKKVLICGEDLFISENTLKGVYPHSFEICSRERICKAILTEEDVVVMIAVPGIPFHMHYFINPASMEIWFTKRISGDEEKNFKNQQMKMFKGLNN